MSGLEAVQRRKNGSIGKARNTNKRMVVTTTQQTIITRRTVTVSRIVSYQIDFGKLLRKVRNDGLAVRNFILQRFNINLSDKQNRFQSTTAFTERKFFKSDHVKKVHVDVWVTAVTLWNKRIKPSVLKKEDKRRHCNLITLSYVKKYISFQKHDGQFTLDAEFVRLLGFESSKDFEQAINVYIKSKRVSKLDIHVIYTAVSFWYLCLVAEEFILSFQSSTSDERLKKLDKSHRFGLYHIIPQGSLIEAQKWMDIIVHKNGKHGLVNQLMMYTE
ncbi:4513_t:CDS:2, partial [Paraglomus brasilianum]